MSARAPLSFLLACVVLAACGPKLSPEEQKQLADLKQQLESTRAEVAATKRNQASYSGGLLKALIDVRLELLKTTDALLDQRVQAMESGAKITAVVSSTKEDPIRAAQLAAELEVQKAKRAQAKAEADRYSGGLLQAMSLVSVATIDNTMAMLEQQQLVAKYGLAIPAPAIEVKKAP